jgi:XFP C-terminal domain
MHDVLEPTQDPSWVLSYEGYNVLSESAVESRFAFGNGFLGMRAARSVSRGPTWVAWLGYSRWASWPLDRFRLVSDVIDRVPGLKARAAYAKQAIRDKLIDHKAHICRYGDDMPEITGWRWGQEAASAKVSSTESDNV